MTAAAFKQEEPLGRLQLGTCHCHQAQNCIEMTAESEVRTRHVRVSVVAIDTSGMDLVPGDLMSASAPWALTWRWNSIRGIIMDDPVHSQAYKSEAWELASRVAQKAMFLCIGSIHNWSALACITLLSRFTCHKLSCKR
jgi:hypothetical protein